MEDKKIPKIFVVTPYYKESLEFLKRCHDSVISQQGAKYDVTHIMVADGFARPEIDDWPVSHVKLPSAHRDYGNTPRAVGGMLAQAEGADFIAYLDADNWFDPSHLASMLRCQQESGAHVVCCMREFYDLSGQRMAIAEADENAQQHVDTSCLLIERSAFSINNFWMMPIQLSSIGDRIVFKGIINSRYRLAFTNKRTVSYTTLWDVHYKSIGQAPPPDAKYLTDEAYKYLTSFNNILETVDRLGFLPDIRH
jgi:glycosyltransferase involved in cell wall biosynthesis